MSTFFVIFDCWALRIVPVKRAIKWGLIISWCRRTQVPSPKNCGDLPSSIISRFSKIAESRSVRIRTAAFQRPLRRRCAAVLSFGVVPVRAVRRRTGGLVLHCQLFLMSKESLHIMGLPDISATVQRMCALLRPREAGNYLKHTWFETQEDHSRPQKGQR